MIAAVEGIFEKDIERLKKEVEVPTKKRSRPIKFLSQETRIRTGKRDREIIEEVSKQ